MQHNFMHVDGQAPRYEGDPHWPPAQNSDSEPALSAGSAFDLWNMHGSPSIAKELKDPGLKSESPFLREARRASRCEGILLRTPRRE